MFQKLAGLVLAVGILAEGAVVQAQTTVLLRTVYLEPFGCPVGGCGPSLFSFDPDNRTVLGKESVPGGTGSYVTPDGALMVWLDAGFGPAALILHDMINPRTTAVPVSPSAAAMIGNPTRPEVYLNDEAGAVALSVAGARRLSSPPCAAPRAEAISENGQRVVYTCLGSGGNPGYTAVLDVGTGALVRSLPFGRSPVLSPDGASLYVAEIESATTRVRRYDVASGALLRDVVLDPALPILSLDPRTGRLLVQKPGGGTEVLDGATLDPVGGFLWFPGERQLAFDPQQPRAYVASSRRVEPGVHFESAFAVIDTDTLAVVDSLSFLSTTAALSLVVAPRAAAPAGLAALVQGANVQLSWSAGASNATALRYVVEAGTTPGLANIAVFEVGLQTSLTVNGVPPGTY